MAIEKIITEWKKKNFKPIYWLEGEEPYFIDKLVAFAEHHLLKEEEANFNRTIFYGKDAPWADVINACRRYPMFAERQIVILKEAQQMRDIEKLEQYIENPLSSTILIISYKEKKLDGRTKFSKLVKEKGELFTSKKLYDNQLPQWSIEMVTSKGFEINNKALMLLVDHVGNDLTRLEHEIDKISVNIKNRKLIQEDDIEEFIGISKEFNVFEFQNALAQKNSLRCFQIIQYFEQNPKSAPIQLILPSLYSFFSKLYVLYGLSQKDEKSAAAAIGVHPFFVKDYLQALKCYPFSEIENVILLLHQYNLRSVGVGDTGTEDASLLKELVCKIVSFRKTA